MMAKWELVKLIRTLTGDRKSLSVHVDNENPLEVQLKGSLPPSAMELTVNSWDDLPNPSTVPVGATAQLIGTFDVRQNTGTEWVEVVL